MCSVRSASILLALFPSVSFAQTIDFETIPGFRGDAPEGLPVTDQFNVSPYNVRFERIDANSGARPATLARVGAPRAAFEGERARDCEGKKTDEDLPNRSIPYDTGCYFLTDDGIAGSSAPKIQPMVVRYSVPVLQASGYILDIDNKEEFTVHARDENGVDVAAPIVLKPSSGSGGNGGASFWFFDVKKPIHSLLFDFTGSGSSRGTAFDQFSPATACPAQVVHHGGGKPGSGNLVPALSVSCARVGQAGTVEIFNGAGGVHGCLGISLDPTMRPYRCGSFLFTSPSFVKPHVLSAGAAGQGRFSLTYPPIPASLAGAKVYLQAGYCDPGAPCGELALTEVVEVTVF